MKQIDIVGRRKIWFTISIVLIVIAIPVSYTHLTLPTT